MLEELEHKTIVLSDVDGTLRSQEERWVAGLRIAFKLDVAKALRSYIVGGMKGVKGMHEIMAAAFREQNSSDEEIQEFYRQVALKNPPVEHMFFSGVMEIIEETAAAGKYFVPCTASNEHEVQATLEHAGVAMEQVRILGSQFERNKEGKIKKKIKLCYTDDQKRQRIATDIPPSTNVAVGLGDRHKDVPIWERVAPEGLRVAVGNHKSLQKKQVRRNFDLLPTDSYEQGDPHKRVLHVMEFSDAVPFIKKALEES